LYDDAVAQPLFQPWLSPQSGGPPTMRPLPRERLNNPQRLMDRPNRGFSVEEGRTIVSRRGIAQHLQRQTVDYATSEPAGTIIVDTANTYLYLVLGQGKAVRYGIGVGREGFTWSGRERISRMAEWPNWRPPAEMLEREPHLPDFMPGGPNNPLGARALYLGNTLYRIHGTNEPSSIGTHASSGCIRLLNEDVMDLYQRVAVGTSVVVLPNVSTR
jgi:lipoprotein-anchoring transpeptidase ErfK/SrfK